MPVSAVFNFNARQNHRPVPDFLRHSSLRLLLAEGGHAPSEEDVPLRGGDTREEAGKEGKVPGEFRQDRAQGLSQGL